jgi:hypothetical protein
MAARPSVPALAALQTALELQHMYSCTFLLLSSQLDFFFLQHRAELRLCTCQVLLKVYARSLCQGTSGGRRCPAVA